MATKNTTPKKKTKEDSPQKSKSKIFDSPWTYIVILSHLGACLFAYRLYDMFTTAPELPQFDLDKYWGTYPMDQTNDKSIKPFEIEFSDVMINDLRERLLHRHPFTEPLEGAGFTYGFNTAFLTRVLDYWQNKYDFKQREQYLNKYPHYKTNIQGLDIHFLHVKPKLEDGVKVIPLLLVHGWPGSVREFYELIPKLTTRRPQQNFVFELVIPSLPGFGFSQATTRPGLGVVEISIILRNLMQRVGLHKFYVQGGGWGHAIGSSLATLFPDQVLGFHTNTPAVSTHPVTAVYDVVGAVWPSLLEPEAALRDRWGSLGARLADMLQETGFVHLQATKPDTIGIALSDSPSGLAAYILEKFSTYANRENRRAADGNLLDNYHLTHLLDNLMMYWSSGCVTTSMRLYAESLKKETWDRVVVDRVPTTVPTWGIKFKHDIIYQPDVYQFLKYKNYLHSTVVEVGGHFAALEQPDILADDIFTAVETFLAFHNEGGKSSPVTETHEAAKTIYDFTVKDINGKHVKLDKYKGYTLVIVNVASQCGLTDTNYNELNELYEKYASRGLRILAFPCNQFGGQEPGTARDILTFVRNRGVKFDLFEKVEVNGDDAHPLWKFLKEKQAGTLGDSIKWNFSKFIIDRNGIPVERVSPTTNPMAMEPYLAKYL